MNRRLEKDKDVEPLISVLVPVYNGEQTIEKCLRSIAGGGYHNIEIVVVNDGSTDRTEDIVRSMQGSDDRIRLITQENKGPSGSRSTCLRNAAGEYVAWCDSDDWVEPAWLETMYRKLKEYEADIIVCGVRIPGGKASCEPDRIIVWEGDEALDAYLEHGTLNGVLWNKLFRGRLFDGVDFDDRITYWEDDFVVWQVLQRARRVVRLCMPLYNFVPHEGSFTTRKIDAKRLGSSMRLWDGIVRDCMLPGMEPHLENAEARRLNWFFGELMLMFRDGYRDAATEKRIQGMLRRGGWRRIEDAQHRAFARLVATSPSLARVCYRLMKRC